MTNGTETGERLLTRVELAKAIGVSLRTVDRMLKDREITPIVLQTRVVRFYLPDVVRQLVATALTSKRGCAHRLAERPETSDTKLQAPGASRTCHQPQAPSTKPEILQPRNTRNTRNA